MTAGTRQALPRLRRPAEPAARPPVRVLLLHGMGAGVSSWDGLAPLLAPQLELWDVSLPWSLVGDSAWAREPEVAQWVSAPVEDVRRVAGDGPDVIVAHSFAANVLLELLTGSQPAAARAAVLVSPFYRAGDTALDWRSVVPSLQDCYARVAGEIQHKRGSRMSDDGSEAVARRLYELMGAYAPLRFYETYQRTPSLALESLTVPVLLVVGDDDRDADPAAVRALSERIPAARLEIIEGSGHFPIIDRARELAGLINNFVARTLPREGG